MKSEEFETVPYWALSQRIASVFRKLEIVDDWDEFVFEEDLCQYWRDRL